MNLFFYNLALALVAVPVRWWLRRHHTYRPLLARFAPPAPAPSPGTIWVQACSLGEVNTARPLVDALRERYPERTVFITSSTPTGRARAAALFGAENVGWFPFDTRPAVSAFLEMQRPAILVLVETELWPNTLDRCRAGGVPVVIVNGRLGDKHMRNYLRLRFWYRPMVAGLARAGMQSAVHARRIEAIGAHPERTRITGNLKFDAVRDSVPNRRRQRLRAESGFSASRCVLFFASTRPGDEMLASACWVTLREEFPHLDLLIAPRHPDRAGEIAALFGEPILRRTAVRAGTVPRGERVFLLDTVGEMGAFLSLAGVVVMGGSFYPGVGGHNILEPAALGIPTVFGPCMSNFSEAAEVLVSGGGARQVACPEDLYLALSRLLASPGEQRQMGTRARKVVLDNRGATRNNMALIEEVLAAGNSRRA